MASPLPSIHPEVPNIYPNGSKDRFDSNRAPLKVLPGDIFIPKVKHDHLPEPIESQQGAGSASGNSARPNDTEYTVLPNNGSNVPVNNFVDGKPSGLITPFISFRINFFRNGALQVNLTDYLWDTIKGYLYPTIPPIEAEIFTIQQARDVFPDDIESDVFPEGSSNENQAVIGNQEIYLPDFVNFRIRVERNNLLASYVSDYEWDNMHAILKLTIPPVEEEHFKFQAY